MDVNPVSPVKTNSVRSVTRYDGADNEIYSYNDKNHQSTEKSEMSIYPDEKTLQYAVDAANDVLKAINKGFEFEIHEDTNRIIVRVINEDTQEVIKEIPPEKILDMLSKMWRAVGILVDEKI